MTAALAVAAALALLLTVLSSAAGDPSYSFDDYTSTLPLPNGPTTNGTKMLFLPARLIWVPDSRLARRPMRRLVSTLCKILPSRPRALAPSPNAPGASTLRPFPRRRAGVVPAPRRPRMQPGQTFAQSPAPEVLVAATQRYNDIIFAWSTGNGPPGAAAATGAATLTHVDVDVSVSDPDDSFKTLQLGMDESYTLDVPAAGGAASIHAATVWGALWALETLSQMTEYHPVGDRRHRGEYTLAWAPWHVADSPRFRHRGVMSSWTPPGTGSPRLASSASSTP